MQIKLIFIVFSNRKEIKVVRAGSRYHAYFLKDVAAISDDLDQLYRHCIFSIRQLQNYVYLLCLKTY